MKTPTTLHGQTWMPPPLQQCASHLKTYTGGPIKVHGSITVNVGYDNKMYTLDLIVVKGSGPSLLGRDWLRIIPIDWSYLKHIRASPSPKCQEIINRRHPTIFKEELGSFSHFRSFTQVLPCSPSALLPPNKSGSRTRSSPTKWGYLACYLLKMGCPNRTGSQA